MAGTDCKVEQMEERRPDCEKELNRIWERLHQGDIKFDKMTDAEKDQDIEIVTIKTNMSHLISSMGKLTSAIWGMTASIILMLIGFFIWYIQSL